MIRSLARLVPVLLVLALAAACMSPKGETVASQRQAVHKMRSETLAKLYRLRPGVKAIIQRSEGYAVFSNVGINLLLVSAGSGWGIVRDNKNGRETYMKMLSAGLGIGLGVKDFRGVFVFTRRNALRNFVDRGWDASAQADAAAKAGKKGDAFAGAIDVAPGIKLYQLTVNGLALQATIQGTKYWKNDELNAAPAKGKSKS